jgi:hypothetical protein
MPKRMTAIMAAAFIAAAITVLSAPAAHVDASPRPVAEAAQMRSCAERPLKGPHFHVYTMPQSINTSRGMGS